MKITSTELKLRLGKYLRESIREPVEITIRGEPANVLISYRQYEDFLKNKKEEDTTTEN